MWPTGQHRLTFFNRYGAKLKGKEKLVESFTEGVKEGQRIVEEERQNFLEDQDMDCTYVIASFAIDRRIYNSLDLDERWMVQDTKSRW